MVLISELVLVTRNARDKIQVIITSLSQDGNAFIINRVTGQYEGKMTNQPVLRIDKGKAKRSVIQQAELEFNSIVNKYMDKGYKKLNTLTNKKFEDISSRELEELVPTLKTDQSGNLKPMLAKSSDKCQNSVLEKEMFCSRKLNGVRCMMKWDPTKERVITISRGGKNYDVAAQHLTDELHEFLKNHPDWILDGELYSHGQYLQTLSGIARLETWEPRCKILEYWVYDLAIPDKVFSDRFVMLTDLEIFVKNSNNIKVLDHTLTKSWAQIQKLHDQWVQDGFEGLVARKPDKFYEFGKRGSTMIKVKMYQEDEAEIIDYSEKLRDEDFCFIMQTDDGKVFEAKPIGTREMKEEYLQNMDNIIGKKGTYKFFELSKDGVPLQAIFQAVRDYE